MQQQGGGESPHPSQRGQATVEFALVLPLFLALVMVVFQVAIVGRDEVRVEHAARVAAREASLTGDVRQIRAAAAKALPGVRVQLVQRGPVGTNVTVVVSYTSPTDLPVIGPLLPDVHLHARAVMEVER